MHKLLSVIRREFVTRVVTRAYLIGTVLGPLLMAALFILPAALQFRDTGPKQVAVADADPDGLGERLAASLNAATRGREKKPLYAVQRVPAAGRLDAVRDSLLARTGLSRREAAGGLDGVLVVTDTSLATGTVEYLGSNVGSIADMRMLENRIQPVLLRERLQRAGVDSATIASAEQSVSLTTRRVAGGRVTEQSGEASFFLAYVMDFVLYLALILYGVQVMTSVVEEKSSRIMEILVSSLSPFQMMLGKVLGVGAAGLLQIGIWAVAAMAVTTYGVQIARVFGADLAPDALGGIPSFTPDLLVVFLLFFVAGFLLYSALYAAIGAMCNSTQETQQASTPVTLLIVAGLISMFALLGEPNGTLARTLSLVPFVAPFVTPIRYALTPLGLGELVLSLLSTVAGMLVITWLAARIYRVGILAYGKRPTLAELLRWLRTA